MECVDLDTLCSQSDVITLHLPLSEETKGIIGRECLLKMKKSAILVNMARGEMCIRDSFS